MERTVQQMLQQLLAMQEKADADRKAYQEKVEAEHKAWLERIKTFWQADREETDIKLKELTETAEKTVLNRNKIPKEEVAVDSETAPSQEATKTERDPEMMQSAEEHQEFPKEDAAVMPVGEPRKRRRDRNLAAGRRQKPKRSFQASCEYKKRSAAARRKMTRRATVAWRKRRVFRKIVTQRNVEPRSKLTAAGI
jgi:hypothetical protein